jgi:hypothetical protein
MFSGAEEKGFAAFEASDDDVSVVKRRPFIPRWRRACEENHTEDVKQVTRGTRFLLTTGLSCSYHEAKSGFLLEFSKKFGKIGFALIEPAEMNRLYEKNKHSQRVFAD